MKHQGTVLPLWMSKSMVSLGNTIPDMIAEKSDKVLFAVHIPLYAVTTHPPCSQLS